MKGSIYLSDRKAMVLESWLPKVNKGKMAMNDRQSSLSKYLMVSSGFCFQVHPRTCRRYFQNWMRKDAMRKC